MFAQFSNGVFSEKFRRDAFRRCFLGNGFRAVLAEFRHRPVIRIGPCATWTIETFELIDRKKSFGASQRTHGGEGVFHRMNDGRNTTRDRRRSLAN